MKRRSFLAVSSVAVALMTGTAIGQQRSLKDQLVGTWMVTSEYNTLPDGKRLDANGPSPKGMVVFDAGGRFTEQIIDSTLSKYASNNRQQGTPQDYERVARGVIAFYGTYTVDGDNSITMHVDYSSYPNMNGTAAKREVKVTGDELQIVNRSAPSGGAAYVTLKRAK